MKLLELIVKNVKREDIDCDSMFFAQDNDSLLAEYSKKPNRYNCDDGWHFHNCTKSYKGISIDLAEDATTTIITRKELMKAYDLVEQGYTLWFGGECPVGDDVVVDVALRCEEKGFRMAREYSWVHNGGGDIIAYRVKGKNKVEDEIKKVDKESTIDIIQLISSVAPNVSVSDAIEIANTMIDEGYHK